MGIKVDWQSDMMLRKYPSIKKLICIVLSCAAFIFIGLFAVVRMPNLEMIKMLSFFSEVNTYTDVTNTSLSFSANARDTTVMKYSKKQFVTTVSVPFNRSHFKIKGSDDSFSKENINSTLLNISSTFRVKEVSCSAIFSASEKEISKAKNIAKHVGNSISDEKYINLTYNCQSFIAKRGYIMSSLTEEEKNFPLAFSISTYTGAEMFERLLRAIYRPQNYYCIQVDKSASDTFFKAVSGIVDCFPNVFLASQRIDVVWGEFTVLETELICMKDLWQFPKWKYFFTLTGQEFPLKTNFELVKILTAYQGANDVMTTVKHANPDRWYNTFPPHGLKPVKGSVHIIVNRDYVHYILHNQTAEDLLQWTKKTFIPDETFFAILNANPQLGIKGTYKGEPEHSATRPFLARYKVWEWDPVPCAGTYVRDVCILTTGDLPLLGQAKEMFANKFFLDWDRVVIGCLEEKIFNDTRDEYSGVKSFDTSYYSNLDFVTNQVT